MEFYTEQVKDMLRGDARMPSNTAITIEPSAVTGSSRDYVNVHPLGEVGGYPRIVISEENEYDSNSTAVLIGVHTDEGVTAILSTVNTEEGLIGEVIGLSTEISEAAEGGWASS